MFDTKTKRAALYKEIIISFAALIVFDQITKIIAQKLLENIHAVELIPGFLSLYFFKNEITQPHRYIIYFVINFIAMPGVILYSIKKELRKEIIAGMVLLWSAVFSNNIIDVFTFGYIRDFIYLHGIAVGNIADQYRTIGALFIIYGLAAKEKQNIDGKKIFIIILITVLFLILIMLFWKYLAKDFAI